MRLPTHPQGKVVQMHEVQVGDLIPYPDRLRRVCRISRDQSQYTLYLDDGRDVPGQSWLKQEIVPGDFAKDLSPSVPTRFEREVL